MVDSTSVVLHRRLSSDVIWPKSYELQSQWFPLDFSVFWSASWAKQTRRNIGFNSLQRNLWEITQITQKFQITISLDKILLPLFIHEILDWELVKSIVGTKFRRSHVCLHSQAGNRLWQLMALLFFVMLWSFLLKNWHRW